MKRSRDAVSIALSVLLVVGSLTVPTVAQGPALPGLDQLLREAPPVEPAPARDRTFGTQDAVAHTITAADFQKGADTGTWEYSPAPGPLTKFDTASGQLAGVRLPAGAAVQSVQLEACDTDAANGVVAILFSSGSPGGPAMTTLAVVGTGAAETPGCGFFPAAPVAPLTIDNAANAYYVLVGAPTALARFAAVRIFYTLQVSPAPAVASFTDVPPGHPFFQFVEALKASGITSGCAATVYCVDDPITRGEMAVFLSKGLGLHVAP